MCGKNLYSHKKRMRLSFMQCRLRHRENSPYYLVYRSMKKLEAEYSARNSASRLFTLLLFQDLLGKFPDIVLVHEG